MKLPIRSITYSIDFNKVNSNEYQDEVSSAISSLKEQFKSNGFFVRTYRLNIIPIKQNERLDKFLFLKKIKVLNEFAKSLDIRWYNIAFDLVRIPTKDVKTICSIAYDIIKNFNSAFINFIVANDQEINSEAAKICSELIINISRLSSNGYDNFRVGISMNPSVYTPFFPFSFADKDLSFSIGVETGKAFISTLEKSSDKTLEVKRRDCISNLAPPIKELDTFSRKIDSSSAQFEGMDISLAPYPDEKISVIEILKLLGLDEIGANGTLFLTSFLTRILKKIIVEQDIKSVGFNGVMYSLLEDHLMCESNNKKLLSLDKIISYSALCGCGLDMVPIPGNILVEELASIILDVAVLAIQLKKPLGVRVLPIPNKEANEFTFFDMDFLTNTRVMKLKNVSLSAKTFHEGSFYFV